MWHRFINFHLSLTLRQDFLGFFNLLVMVCDQFDVSRHLVLLLALLCLLVFIWLVCFGSHRWLKPLWFNQRHVIWILGVHGLIQNGLVNCQWWHIYRSKRTLMQVSSTWNTILWSCLRLFIIIVRYKLPIILLWKSALLDFLLHKKNVFLSQWLFTHGSKVASLVIAELIVIFRHLGSSEGIVLLSFIGLFIRTFIQFESVQNVVLKWLVIWHTILVTASAPHILLLLVCYLLSRWLLNIYNTAITLLSASENLVALRIRLSLSACEHMTMLFFTFMFSIRRIHYVAAPQLLVQPGILVLKLQEHV